MEPASWGLYLGSDPWAHVTCVTMVLSSSGCCEDFKPKHVVKPSTEQSLHSPASLDKKAKPSAGHF